MKNKTFWYSCFLLLSYNAFSQSTDELNTIKIIQKGIDFHDNKKYDEAIAEYKKVSRSDSNYVLAASELATTYVESGKDSLALSLCNDLLEIPSSYIPSLLSLKANALDDLKRSDEAIKVYEEGMKRFPLNYSYTYELGILKVRQKKYKEAYDWFVKSVKVNPYHANTHYYLGYLAMKQGKQVPTMLAWLFYLTIDNSSDRAKEIVLNLEAMAKNEFDYGEITKIEELDEQDDFSEIETLVKSKIALDKKYKSETKLNFNITKQIQLIMEKMQYEKSDKGFFMQFYAPFYLDLYNKKKLEPFSYSILSGMENKEINSWVKSNNTKIKEYATWMVRYLSEGISYYEENLNGKMVMAHHYYSEANSIFSVGNFDAKGAEIGYWNYYYSNGIKKSEGGFNDNNQRNGMWKYYNTGGVISSTENYVNGKIEGLIEIFYPNGSIDTRKNLVNDLLEGEQLIYYPTGVLKSSYQYKADVQNGKEKQFHPNGKLDYEVNVINGKYDGDIIRYYMDGHMMQKLSFKEGKRVGKYVRYYDYPQNVISDEGTFEKGNITGVYKEYHKNGKVSVEGEYSKEGEKNGTWKEYTEDNILILEETYNNGKSSGITKKYDNKGILTEEYIYKNNMLQEYKAYAKDGKVINQSEKDGKGSYDVKLFYANGNVKREGKVKNGELEGKWKNYHEDGYLSSDENFVAGKREGKFYYYWENGKIQAETEYAKDERNGYYKSFYKNGVLQKEGGYVNGEQVGEWRSYYADGSKEAVNFYKDGNIYNWQQYYSSNGKLDYEDLIELDYIQERRDYDTLGKRVQTSVLNKGSGLLDIKYPDGKSHYKVNFVNDLKQGPYIISFPNGKPYYVRNYVDNQLEGDLKTYYPNGQIRSEEKYVGGDIEGKSIKYYENGNIESSFEYLNGKENGKSYTYYDNKQIKTEYSYKNNVLEGKTIFYTETGDLIIVRNYEEGILVSYQYNDKTGNLCAPIPVKNETGAIKSYFKSGATSLEYNLKCGSIEGKRTQYFADGKVAEESTFISDDREGPRKVYYPSGKIKQVENWKADIRSGTNTMYYENGKIKSEEFYQNGAKFGPVKNYNEKGELVKTYFYYDDELVNEK